VRLRVQFRYRVETGEVEIFQVEDLADGPRLPDHDARHDQATRNLAQIIDPHARITEVEQAVTAEPGPAVAQGSPAAEETAAAQQGPIREGPQR